DPRFDALHERQVQLQSAHSNKWLAALPLLPGGSWGRSFERGVVAAAHFPSARTFLAPAGHLPEFAPVRTLSRDRLSPPALAQVAESPDLARFTGLDACGVELGEVGVLGLLGSPHLRGLRSLKLSGLDDRGARQIAVATHLTQLQHLDLSGG